MEELRVLQGLVELGTSALAKALHHQHAEESRARLQLLSRRLVEIQESERRYLASELHDEIGQMLSSLNLNLEYVSQAVQSPMSPRSEVLERLSSIRAQVGGLLAQVRNLALDLRPALLDDLGLLPALLDYFERYTCTTHIQVNLKQSGVYGRFATHIETAAFRIIQEALNNVAKHAKAETVDVLLWVEEDRLGVVIKDPGIGFNVQQAARYGATSGLSGMSERAAACGGTLEIDSQPGRGTTLTLEIPLQPYQAGEGG